MMQYEGNGEYQLPPEKVNQRENQQRCKPRYVVSYFCRRYVFTRSIQSHDMLIRCLPLFDLFFQLLRIILNIILVE